MASSRPTSTSSTDPESRILQQEKKKKTEKKRKQQNVPSASTRRSAHSTLTLLSLILLTLASISGIVFAVLATAVLHLHVAGDVPSRLVVFATSSVSVVMASLQVITICLSPASLSFVRVILARVLIVAWVAAIVLSSLVVAQIVHIATVSSTLAAQAIYLNLLISGVAFIATGILSFCLERNARRVNDQATVEDCEDDAVLNRSVSQVSQRGSLVSLAKSNETFPSGEAAEEPAEEPAVEPRPKKLRFSYKATTQLIEEKPGSWWTSMTPVPNDMSAAAPPPEPVVAGAAIRPTSSIKRKPVHSAIQPRAPSSAADRRKSMMPAARMSARMSTVLPPTVFSDPFADPVEDPFAGRNRIPDTKPVATTTASRRLSKMPTQALPKLVTTVAPVTATSIFNLSSSGSSNYEDEDEEKMAKEPFRTSLLPYSPAVTRPVSTVPPVPQVPVPQIPASQVSTSQAPAPTMVIPRLKPVGGVPTPASTAPASTTVQTTGGPIKRKPVPSMRVNAQTVVAPTTKRDHVGPLSPMSQPFIPSLPVKFSSSSFASAKPLSPLTQPSTNFTSFSSAISSRQSSNASTASEESVAPSAYSTPSLADMVASYLRRASVVPGNTEGGVGVAVSSAVSKVLSSSSAAPPPTRSVTYSQPRVLDQPIVRKSFIATAGSGNGNVNGNGRTSNSRRPSEVSIMETIYSPAEGDDEQEESDQGTEDADLAAMVRQEAEAAAAAADAGRRWLEPSRESIREPPPRIERTLSVSKPLSKRPYLSPVEEEEDIEDTEKEEESSEEEEEEEKPTVHTIVFHEPSGFTATGLSRTASRIRKAALQAAKQTTAGTMAPAYTPASVPAYTRSRLSTTANYNFSRPMREAGALKRASVVSTATKTTSPSKRASLVVPALPQTSLLVSPRSRIRRQLLQMLPMQKRPILLVKTKQQDVSARKQTLRSPSPPVPVPGPFPNQQLQQ